MDSAVEEDEDWENRTRGHEAKRSRVIHRITSTMRRRAAHFGFFAGAAAARRWRLPFRYVIEAVRLDPRIELFYSTKEGWFLLASILDPNGRG
jgi:hypothetical protein